MGPLLAVLAVQVWAPRGTIGGLGKKEPADCRRVCLPYLERSLGA